MIALVSIGLSAGATDQQTPAGPHSPAQPQPTWYVPGPGPSPAAVPFCFGDGTGHACPCENTGAPGRGCQNSGLGGGAMLWANGESRLTHDTLNLNVVGELPTSLSVVLQGDVALPATNFGDGLRCVGGALKRLYIVNAANGMLSVPQAGDPTISQRSTELGGLLPPGSVRHYQVYYRDPAARYCEFPWGDTFNVTNGVTVTWVK